MDPTQRGVAIGMASALGTTIAVLIVAVIVPGAQFASGASLELRMWVLALSIMAPALSLLISISRMAKHRFFSPEDINGSALTQGTERAKLLQSLLQNTLEQLALALPVYVSSSVIFPGPFLCTIPTSAAMFFVGRILFFAGYAKGAPARAFGFALTFYPTVVLAFAVIYFLIRHCVA